MGGAVVAKGDLFKVGLHGLSEDMEDFICEKNDYYENNKTKFWSNFWKTCVDMWSNLIDLSCKQLEIINREYDKIKKERGWVVQ